MFTGLVQKVGRLAGIHHGGLGRIIQIRSVVPWEEPLQKGESIAVQGCCLTVTQIHEDGFDADMLEETFACTAFGELGTNAAVNLERALRASDRMGGHIVQGHVDAKAAIVSITPQERDWRVRLSCSGEAARYVVNKGSVALDGISLTVSHLPARGLFEVDIIPTTWRETSLHDRKPGDHVNLETDIIGRFVEHFLMNGYGEAGNGIDEALLRKAGFLP